MKRKKPMEMKQETSKEIDGGDGGARRKKEGKEREGKREDGEKGRPGRGECVLK